jgi:hypothetical protein
VRVRRRINRGPNPRGDLGAHWGDRSRLIASYCFSGTISWNWNQFWKWTIRGFTGGLVFGLGYFLAVMRYGLPGLKLSIALMLSTGLSGGLRTDLWTDWRSD